MITFFSVLLAILALSFLIFIHELGHYWAARRVGMRVETFSIGFGPALYSWKWHDVDWRISALPFGGYVTIAGGGEDENKDPYSIPDGFFGVSPWKRIFVSLAGPLANLLFALLALSMLYMIGGREKPLSELSPLVGWVDPKSSLYEAGLRPGDRILSYNGTAFRGDQDHTIAAMTSPEVHVEALHYDEQNHPTPISVTITPYSNPLIPSNSDIMTTGVLQSGSYLIYHPEGQVTKNSLAEGSPLLGSGISSGDMLVWANGERIYSQYQLKQLLERDEVLLTVQRGKDTFLRRTPRLRVEDLKLSAGQREELTDWQYEALLNKKKITTLYMIPYNLTSNGVVEHSLQLIEPEEQLKAFPTHKRLPIDEPLAVGDKIIAVSGKPILHSYELLTLLQEPSVLMIVKKPAAAPKAELTLEEASHALHEEFPQSAWAELIQNIGLSKEIKESGPFKLLQPITPKIHQDFAVSPEAQKAYTQDLADKRNKIEQIESREEKALLLRQLDKHTQDLHLGPPYFVDQVIYDNPPPLTMFSRICSEIFGTLKALFTGNLSPKWLSGPIGMIQVVQEHSQAGLQHALYWLALVSINLGLLNLLPIPVLDGGSICFSLFEAATGTKLSPKLLEKFITPFALMLMILILFLTYQDILRLVQRLLHY